MSDNKTIYFPGLNGLRALSAIGVVITHTTISLAQFRLDPRILGEVWGNPKGYDLGHYGVIIFFTLSGFLITYLLQAEKDKTKDINIPKFYLRRTLRIWPLYFLFIILVTFMFWYSTSRIKWDFLVFYIFFGANFLQSFTLKSLPLLGHYWSIAIEEQFYLVWPWLIKKIETRLVTVLVVLISSVVILKFWIKYITIYDRLSYLINDNCYHCMLIGALGGILFFNKQEAFMKIATHNYTQMVAWICFAIILINQVSQHHLLYDIELVSCMTVCIIIGQIAIERPLVSLENPVFDYLGKISYSIYVLHAIAIYLYASFWKYVTLPNYAAYPLVYLGILGLTILFAHLSYSLIELRFIQLKNRFMIIKSAGSKSTKYL